TTVAHPEQGTVSKQLRKIDVASAGTAAAVLADFGKGKDELSISVRCVGEIYERLPVTLFIEGKEIPINVKPPPLPVPVRDQILADDVVYNAACELLENLDRLRDVDLVGLARCFRLITIEPE